MNVSKAVVELSISLCEVFLLKSLSGVAVDVSQLGVVVDFFQGVDGWVVDDLQFWLSSLST